MEAQIDFAAMAFARGYLIFGNDRALADRIERMPGLARLGTWEKVYFGPVRVWTDPRLGYAVKASNKIAVAVLGLCIDPFRGLNTNQAIADALYDALTAGDEAFYDRVDGLGGSFLILFRRDDDVVALQDAAAARTAFYTERGTDPFVLASHEPLAAAAAGLVRDPRAVATRTDMDYIRDPSPYLPGTMTHYTGLVPMTPNCELRLRTRKTRRFFPRAPLVHREFGDDLVADLTDLLRRQAGLLAALGRPLRLALTAGRDSRVSAATFADVADLEYFTFATPRRRDLQEDVATARRIVELCGGTLNVYDLSTYASQTFSRAFNRNCPASMWPSAALCYATEFPLDAIHIRSTVSEIGRMFYRKRPGDPVSPQSLAETYTQTAFWRNPLALDALAGFIPLARFDDTQFHGYDWKDMFYWEHRNAKWQNNLCLEAEMATDVFIPFNNREILKKFLSVPPDARRSARLHEAICVAAMPALAGVPFNS